MYQCICFFSSRRRHTRYWRDWSSDVCSSDLDAEFRLTSDPVDEVRSRMESYRRHRAETQPGALQNAGSTFKNPPGDAAGRLVEAAGLKGHRVGRVAVSSIHANFFVADDGATAPDVYDLVHDVRRIVSERMGVTLDR